MDRIADRIVNHALNYVVITPRPSWNPVLPKSSIVKRFSRPAGQPASQLAGQLIRDTLGTGQ
ncbi:hypothetical protein Tdes44962_MAKER00025 [Teratosphaeria destructans]|uniref:Uncharacterized protein n=1 Tax=Teratosphaeria destructans TaxID=418781 RepID=A0A9W7T2R3_9PEZI|nr:hypothetical protein Tdes44962_MAKER00025 [Teratosphaeria destructans]